jgi:phosphotriesterase-related protein
MPTQINTVTGPISPDDLGKTLMHEHFFFGYPGFQGDSLGFRTREELVSLGVEVAERAKSQGVKTVVDATPNECGRDPELLREVSERSGIQIVCSTGYYYEGEGATAYFKFRSALGPADAEVEELMMTELTEGIGDTGVKAGVIKLASSKDVITDYEKMFMLAGAKAQGTTGVPIITHTQEGTMGPEQAALLVEAGANPDQVMVGHMDGNTDIAYHMATLAHGVSVGFDRFGIQVLVGAPMDAAREATLIGLLGMGYGDRIMLSHDTVNIWMGRPLVMSDEIAGLLENWHITHLFENVVPVLQNAGISDERINAIFTENPKRLFDPSAAPSTASRETAGTVGS